MRILELAALVGVVALLGACSGGAEDLAESEDPLNALSNGAGAGVPNWDEDHCENPAKFANDHGYHLIVAKPDQHVVHGTPGRDVIVGTDEADHIWGGAGGDFICAGYGEDYVHGDNRDDGNPSNDTNDGPDYIDGGGDNDHLFGDGGKDLIHGRGGSDTIFGGPDDDILLGDILDDDIFGEEGDDLLIGGHGTDLLMGGPGNDYLRGDTGNDAFIGGPGKDVASFVTAMPPGQGEKVNGPPNAIHGVKIDFGPNGRCEDQGFDLKYFNGRKQHDGCANGDGGNEPLDSIETVLGSPYDDVFIKGGEAPKFIGGYGDDRCDGVPCGKGAPNPAAVMVAIDETPRDTGLVVIGRDQDDALEIYVKNHHLVVHAKGGTPLATTVPCALAGDTVTCPIAHTLRWVGAFMGAGEDVATFGDDVPGADAFNRDVTVHASGGDDDDKLFGGDEQDVFFTGPTGVDWLYGKGGGDALLSESRKWAAMDCSNLTKAQQAKNPRCTEDKPIGAKYADGPDHLYGGPGDDQLVTDYPCGAHFNSGGGGKDIAGFARSGRFDLWAQLAGNASVKKNFAGKAFNPQLCDVSFATRFDPGDDLEILEAADGDDELWGNDRANVIWGREGDDHIHGLAGKDTLWGLLGEDWVYGGGGDDEITGAEHAFPNDP